MHASKHYNYSYLVEYIIPRVQNGKTLDYTNDIAMYYTYIGLSVDK